MSNQVYSKYSGESRMFFGEGHGIQEFVDTPYPEFLKLKDQQRDLQWAHDEFPLQLDAAQLAGANQSIRHVFTSNLQSQIFADSVQGRGPGWLLPYCSDPSLEGLLLEWAVTEVNHSRSYTQMLTAMYPNPKIVTDLIEEKPEIFNRFSQSLISYDNFFDNPNEENLVLLIGAINILEGLAFYSSFACNFGFANMGLFESVGKYLALISRDECLTGDHEVLTPEGWVRLDTIRDSQLVAQFDPTNSNISFVVPSKIIKTTTDTLITFKGDTVSQVVTPNHRMPVLKDNTIDFKTPSGISDQSGLLPTIGLKIGGLDVLQDEIKVLIPIKLYGYLVDVSDHDAVILLSDKNQANDYEKTLKDSSVSYTKNVIEFPDQSNVGSTITQTMFNIVLPSSYTLTNNTISEMLVDLSRVSSNWCLQFIDYLSKWFGTTNKLGYLFNSADKVFIDRLQAIIHLSGKHTSLTTNTDIITNKYYSLQVLKNTKAIDYSTITKTSESVDGDTQVYCLTVDTGAFLVRHNNQVSVTGNCLHVAFTQKIIKNWSSGKDGKLWREVWHDNKNKIQDMYVTGLHEETSWSKYLFKHGTPIIGLNEKLLNDYNEYMSYKRMRNIGLKLDTKVTKDPLPWIQLKYGSQKNVSNAPQEVKVIAYTKNPINRMEDLSDLKKLII